MKKVFLVCVLVLLGITAHAQSIIDSTQYHKLNYLFTEHYQEISSDNILKLAMGDSVDIVVASECRTSIENFWPYTTRVQRHEFQKLQGSRLMASSKYVETKKEKDSFLLLFVIFAIGVMLCFTILARKKEALILGLILLMLITLPATNAFRYFDFILLIYYCGWALLGFLTPFLIKGIIKIFRREKSVATS